MYFWRIRKLRQALITAPLSEKQSLQYLLAFVCLGFIALFFLQIFRPPIPLAKSIFIPYLLSILVIKLGGVYYCYYKNGAATGTDFLKKFIAIAWVSFCRFFVFGLIILILGLFGIEFFIQKRILITPHHFWICAFAVVLLLGYFYRVGRHLEIIRGL